MASASPPAADALSRALFASAEDRIYAVVDCARDQAILPLIRSGPLGSAATRCLLGHAVPEAVARVAPHVLALERGAALTDALLGGGWGAAWGVFAAAPCDLDDLSAHLRRLLLAAGPAGERLYFRFYDPRVLRVYLPTCTGGELAALFGPVRRFDLEDEAGAALLRWERAPGERVSPEFRTRTIPLAESRGRGGGEAVAAAR